jgi:hypothetical protein
VNKIVGLALCALVVWLAAVGCEAFAKSIVEPSEPTESWVAEDIFVPNAAIHPQEDPPFRVNRKVAPSNCCVVPLLMAIAASVSELRRS